MLYLVFLFAGIIAALITGGKLENIVRFRFKKAWIVLAALVLQVFTDYIQKSYGMGTGLYVFLKCLSYAALLAAFLLNGRYFGMLFVSAGMLMNATAISLNNGKMPVDMALLQKHNLTRVIEYMKSGGDLKHTIINSETKLTFLTDIIRPPLFLHYFNELVSVGDIFVAAGIGIIAFEVLRGIKIWAKLKTANSNMKEVI